MNGQYDGFGEEREDELRRQRRAQRYAQARREKERQLRRRRMIRGCLLGAVCLVGVCGIIALSGKAFGKKDGKAEPEQARTGAASGEVLPSASGRSLADITGYDEAGEAGLGGVAVSDSEQGAGQGGAATDGAQGAGMGSGADGAQGAGTGSGADSEQGAGTGSGADGAPSEEDGMIQVGEAAFRAGFTAKETESTHGVDPEQVTSTYALLIDESTDEIVAEQNAYEIMNPASMTKILTVLVAAEHVQDLDEKVTITVDVTDYAFSHDCSTVGFSVDEQVPVRDLFYGTVLPSGADAAVALAVHVAGSQEAFVEMMNDKLAELGLSSTAHFTNCVGLYDKEHHCTIYDMAMILKAAVENDLCREVLSAHTYTTVQTAEHPEGITISNWFLRRIEDKDTGGEVICAKTGFVNQSGNCAASYQITDSGRPYICVTADAHSSWRCIYDHVAMYSLYAE